MPLDDIISLRTPSSQEAERAVIGSMLIEPPCIPDVLGALGEDDFYYDLHREIFSTIHSMFNYAKIIDPVTILAQMKESSTGGENTGQYLLELMEMTPTAANVMEYVRIVRDMSLLRAIAEAGTDITQMASSGEGGAAAVLDAAESRIYSLRQGRNTQGLEPVSKILAGVFKQISEAAKLGTDIPGMPTGLTYLDRMIMGMNNSDLIIFASRPGMGKTSIALNIALHAARTTGKTVAFYTLEMSREQLALRLLSSKSRIDNKKLQTGRLSENEWNDLTEAAADISKSDILINDNALMTVSDINAQCRRIKDLGLVVIDYLQLMQSASGKRNSYSNETRTQVVSEISRMLKIMAKELNVPVLCACQLSRQNESRHDKRPMLSDLRESGAIEQDADIVLGLYREDYYDKETEDVNIAECIVLKNRRGETGTVYLQWTPEFTMYTTLEQTRDENDY